MLTPEQWDSIKEEFASRVRGCLDVFRDDEDVVQDILSQARELLVTEAPIQGNCQLCVANKCLAARLEDVGGCPNWQPRCSEVPRETGGDHAIQRCNGSTDQ
jgi:hypothetical protein